MSSQFNDSHDDVALPSRRSAAAGYPADSGRPSEIGDKRPAEREVTLNTGVVLALFFALALLCAVFFGFGYSIGHKSVPPPVAAEPDPATNRDTAAADTPKPVPGSISVPDYVPPSGSDRQPQKPAAGQQAAAGSARAAIPPAVREEVVRPVASRPVATTAAAPTVAVAMPAPTPPAQPGSSYVQIAAVSHQEDADVLLSALRRRGYAVLARSDSNDKLIHVQVGPFGTRKEAEAMRQKLAGDGYNAFIK